MIDDTENNEIEKRKKDETEGEGKGRSGKGRVGGGTGEAGAGSRSGIAFSVDATQLKEIWANWHKMDLGECVSVLIDFVNEGVLRAAANLSVDWPKAAALKDAGYALPNKLIAFMQDMSRATRERTREATAYVQRKYGVSFKIKRGGQTIITSAPNPGG